MLHNFLTPGLYICPLPLLSLLVVNVIQNEKRRSGNDTIGLASVGTDLQQ